MQLMLYISNYIYMEPSQEKHERPVIDGCNENTLIHVLNQSMYGFVVSQVLIDILYL
jgi:hypothetical protein